MTRAFPPSTFRPAVPGLSGALAKLHAGQVLQLKIRGPSPLWAFDDSPVAADIVTALFIGGHLTPDSTGTVCQPVTTWQVRP